MRINANDWKVIASALLMLWIYVTVATAAYLLRDRTLTVKFAVDRSYSTYTKGDGR